MTEMPARRIPAWLDTLVLASATGALTITAAFVMFSKFMFYDDEGYVLISLRDFARHGGLYRDVYTQYGPFPFVFYYGLQSLGIPLTHNFGRLIALGAWAGTAWSCAVLVGHVTRNLLVRLAVLAAVFVYLWVMANEPTHPGGLIVFFTALLAVFGYRWIVRGQELPWAMLVGGGTAVLLLTKINIGIFLAFSAGSWLLLHHRSAAVRRWAPSIVAVWCAVLPLALMRSLLGAAWVQTFAWVFACSGVALALVGTGATRGYANWRTLVVALATAGVFAAVVLGAVLLHGTQPRDLIEGILLSPLRQPVVFSLGYAWLPGIRAIAATSLAACAIAWALHRRGLAGVDVAIAGLRLLGAVALGITVACYPAVRPDYNAFSLVLPFLWVYAWPLAGEDPSRVSARAWLAFLLLGQSLHVFPVPGSQIGWGTVLVVPLVAIGASQAARWLVHHFPNAWLASRPTALAAGVAVASFTTLISWKFTKVAERYWDGQNLEMPGAEMIRLPDGSAALYRVMTHNAVAHADMLFSLPGMFSFNLWTDLPTPTHANVTHWFSLLDAGRQQEIVRKLEAHPRACVIVHPGHIKFLTERNLAPKGLLFDYIMANFEPTFALDEFEFRVHRGRRIAPFLVAELFTISPAANADRKVETTLLKFTLPPLPGHAVASIQLSSQSTGTSARLDASNARLEIAPANTRGEQVGPAQRLSWPAAIAGPSILSVYFYREKVPPIGIGATIVLRNAQGAEVALARLGP